MDSQPGGYFDGVEINLLVINSLKFEEKTFGLLLFLHTVQINIVFIFHRYILKKKKKKSTAELFNKLYLFPCTDQIY